MATMMPIALHQHVAAGESQTLEFKASFYKTKLELQHLQNGKLQEVRNFCIDYNAIGR